VFIGGYFVFIEYKWNTNGTLARTPYTITPITFAISLFFPL
jgi:hypothetical protein